MFKKINDFMNDNDRGPGHGIAQGMFYGFVFLGFSFFIPFYAAVILCVINHCRVLYQELIVENWRSRPKTGDFWYDILFRPLQTDIVFLGFGYLGAVFYPLVLVVGLIVGYKRKNDWPIIIFWK